ncbi:hypothetical protein, partial [Streptomyces mirabilis]
MTVEPLAQERIEILRLVDTPHLSNVMSCLPASFRAHGTVRLAWYACYTEPVPRGWTRLRG